MLLRVFNLIGMRVLFVRAIVAKQVKRMRHARDFFASTAEDSIYTVRLGADARLVWAVVSSIGLDCLKRSPKFPKLGLDGRKCPTVHTLFTPVGF